MKYERIESNKVEEKIKEVKNKIGTGYGYFGIIRLSISEIDNKINTYKNLLTDNSLKKKREEEIIELLLLHLIVKYEKLKKDNCFATVNTVVVSKKMKKSTNGSKIELSINLINSSKDGFNKTSIVSQILKYFVGLRYIKKTNKFTFDYYNRNLVFEYLEIINLLLFMSRTVYIED